MASSGSVGTLSWSAKLDSNEFKKGVRKVKKQMKEAQKAVGESIKIMANGFALATGAIVGVTGALALMNKHSAESALELKKLSSVANTSIKDFQAMAYGAGKFNIEQEKLSDILKDVNDRVGDFVSTGGGPMADFFENIAPKVGVTAEQFKKLGGKDALLLFYDSLEKANISQAEMTFYLEAMASDLTMLQPLLKNNAELLKIMTQEGEQLGTILNEQDFSKLLTAGKAVEDIGSTFKGLANLVSVEFSTAFTKVVDLFNAFTRSFRSKILGMTKVFSSFIENLADWFKTNMQDVIAPALLGIINVVSEIGRAFETLFGFFSKVGNSAMTGMFDTWETSLTDFLVTFKESFALGLVTTFEKVYNFIAKIVLKTLKLLDDFYIASQEVLLGIGAISFDEFTKRLADNAKTMNTVKDAIKGVSDEAKEMKEALEDTVIDKLLKSDKLSKEFAFSFELELEKIDYNRVLMKELEDDDKNKDKESDQGKATEVESASLATAGSVEEFNLLRDQRNQELIESKKQTKLLERISKSPMQSAGIA